MSDRLLMSLIAILRIRVSCHGYVSAQWGVTLGVNLTGSHAIGVNFPVLGPWFIHRGTWMLLRKVKKDDTTWTLVSVAVNSRHDDDPWQACHASWASVH